MPDPDERPLNPALKRGEETDYDTVSTTAAPVDSASAKEDQGEGWPWTWLVVLGCGVIVTVYLLL